MKRSLRVLLAAVAVLAVLCSGAWAATKKTVDPGPITADVHNDEETWTPGTYTLAAGQTATFKERIILSGDVVLMLEDGCTLNAEKGISVKAVSGDKLTINGGPAGTGKLIATGTSANAGIGGTSNAAGTIIINGGMVEATSQNAYAAAIGSVYNTGGVIEINGGTVTAKAHDNADNYAAAIGGGGSSNKSSSDSGKITITGGIVTAIAEKGYGAAIGCGGGDDNPSNQVSSDITITGGIVTARAYAGAAIGGAGCKKGATYFLGGTITITGGVVSADSVNGDGIGTGVNASTAAGTGRGVLSSDVTGTAWIVAKTQSSSKKGIGAWTTGFASGVAFNGTSGDVYGDVTISGDVMVPVDATLVIPAGKSLTIPKGMSMTMGDGSTLSIETNATLTIEADATFDATKGKIINKGTIVNEGLVKLADGTDIAALGMTGDGTVEMGGKTYDNKGNQTGGGGGDEPAKKDDTPVSVDQVIAIDKLNAIPDSGDLDTSNPSEPLTSADVITNVAPTLDGAVEPATSGTEGSKTITKEAAVTALESLGISVASEDASAVVTRMPIRKNTLSPGKTDTLIMFANLQPSDLVSSDVSVDVSSIRVIKVKSADSALPVPAAVESDGSDFTNGRFMITDDSKQPVAQIDPNGGPYNLIVRVTDLTDRTKIGDNDNFDINTTQGTVVDPIIIVKGDKAGSRSSSGACDAGAGLAAAVGLAAIAIRKRSKQ